MPKMKNVAKNENVLHDPSSNALCGVVLVLQQYSLQQLGRPGGLQRAFLSARSLSAPDDGGDCDGLPLLQGGPVHGKSLAGVADVSVVHLEVDLAGSRQDQWGRSRSVFPIRIQIGP